MENQEEKKVKEQGQCAKDSDCGTGYVCVNGKCVPDIAPDKSIDEAAD